MARTIHAQYGYHDLSASRVLVRDFVASSPLILVFSISFLEVVVDVFNPAASVTTEESPARTTSLPLIPADPASSPSFPHTPTTVLSPSSAASLAFIILHST